MSFKQRSITAIFWTIIEKFGLGVISFVIDIFLTRLLNPSDFGIIGMILFFMIIGQTLIDSGLTSSLIRTKDPDQVDYSTVFFINLGASILIYFIFLVSAPYIATFYEQPTLTNILRVYMIGFVIIAFTSIQQTQITKAMDFKKQARIQIVARTLSGMCGIAFTLYGLGVWSLVYMYLINQILLSIQFWIRSKWYPVFQFDFQRLKYHFNYGYKLTLSSLLDNTIGNIYYLIIGRFFSANILGYYTKANQLRQLPVTAISGALNNATFPLFASVQDQPEKLKVAYKKLMQQVLFWICPLLIGAAVMAKPLFVVLFTTKWLPAVPYFQILCLAGILYPVHAYNLNILKVFGRSDLFLRLEMIKKALLVINVVIALQLGIFALLIGQVIASLIAFVINSYYSGRFINYSTKDQMIDIFPIIGLAVVMGTTIFLIDNYVTYSLPYIYRLCTALLTGTAFYLLVAKSFSLAAYQDFWILLKSVKEMRNSNKATSN